MPRNPGSCQADTGTVASPIFLVVSKEEEVPEVPDDRRKILAWAEAHGVSERLDDVVNSIAFPSSRGPTQLTYRQILLERERSGDPYRVEDTARELLHRM